MIFLSSFFCLFGGLALMSSVFVVASKNPIYSMLFLILSFCNVVALLFLINLEFLPIIFLVVYVGAIAVLFLFVVMMLSIKHSELVVNKFFVVIAILLSTLFLSEVFVVIRINFLPLSFSFTNNTFLSDLLSHNVNFSEVSLIFLGEGNIRSLGKLLFVDCYFQFIVVGYVLLFAMIGTITLTIKKTFLSKTQNVYFQVARSFNFCVFFYD